MAKNLGNGVKRYSRKEWGSRYGKGRPSNPSRDHVVAHTTVTGLLGSNESVTSEMAVMRSMERYHAGTRGWNGIGYAEVVTDSGRVYEGRGPGRSLAHATGYNTSAYGFAHMGHGDKRNWLEGGWKAMKALVSWYRSRSWIASNYKVSGHRDVTTSGKSCPGNKVPDHQLRSQLKDLNSNVPQDDGVLRRGDMGDDVRKWQDQLLDYFGDRALPEYGADGDFGEETEVWTKKFQAKEKLPVSGAVGGGDKAHMRAALRDSSDKDEKQESSRRYSMLVYAAHGPDREIVDWAGRNLNTVPGVITSSLNEAKSAAERGERLVVVGGMPDELDADKVDKHLASAGGRGPTAKAVLDYAADGWK